MTKQQKEGNQSFINDGTTQDKKHQLPYIPVKIIHPAIDYKGDDMILGFNDEVETPKGKTTRPVYIIRESNKYEFRFNPTEVKLTGERYFVESTTGLPLINHRWDPYLALDFVESPSYSKDFYRSINETIYEYIDFRSLNHYRLFTLWIISTYFTHLFYAVPYLDLFGPKSSGKTNGLDIVNYLSFNSAKTKITEAAIGDTISDQRGVVIIDQAERIKPDLVGLLADGYKCGGGRRRIVQGTGTNRKIREFSTYGHKAFGANKPLPHDLLDRCIQITMVKTTRKVKDINAKEDCWLKHRDQLYRFALMCWQDVRKYYDELSSDGTRIGELWKSLKAVALALELPDNEIDSIESAFNTCVGGAVNSLTAKEEALLIALGKKAKDTKKDEFELKTSDIKELMKDELDDGNTPSPQWIGQNIALFGLVEAGGSKPKTRKKHVHYTFKPDRVKDIVNCYFDIE
jgi:hypothetical protein